MTKNDCCKSYSVLSPHHFPCVTSWPHHSTIHVGSTGTRDMERNAVLSAALPHAKNVADLLRSWVGEGKAFHWAKCWGPAVISPSLRSAGPENFEATFMLWKCYDVSVFKFSSIYGLPDNMNSNAEIVYSVYLTIVRLFFRQQVNVNLI